MWEKWTELKNLKTKYTDAIKYNKWKKTTKCDCKTKVGWVKFLWITLILKHTPTTLNTHTHSMVHERGGRAHTKQKGVKD